MKSFFDRLQVLVPVIAEICQTSGTPGASPGILYEGKSIYTHNYCYRDLDTELPPDVNAIFHIASSTKTFTVASIGILVEEG